jgi:hypothetical protein
MIRGAIEIAETTRVAGWLFCEAEPLRDKTILAFVGGRCVGAGKIDRFRQDLLDAGLGDGCCGFDIPVWLNEGESAAALIVQLQFSDMALLQPSSRVLGPEVAVRPSGPDFGAVDPKSVSWMMDRGMFDQGEYDFLKAMHNVGAYERALRGPKRGAGQDSAPADPEAVARDLLSLFHLADRRVVGTSVMSVSDLSSHAALLLGAASPVLALWSRERGRISLEERSHLGGPRDALAIGTAPRPGGIDYSFGPDRLLLVHRDCSFAPRGPAPASGLMVLTAPALDGAAAPRPAAVGAPAVGRSKAA